MKVEDLSARILATRQILFQLWANRSRSVAATRELA